MHLPLLHLRRALSARVSTATDGVEGSPGPVRVHRDWNGKTMLGPGMGTQPGRRTGSARSRNSPGTEAASYKTTLEASSYTWSRDEECPVDAAELRMGDEYSSYAAATVTNSTEQPLGDLQMSMVLRDESGNLLEIVGASLYGAELAPGSTITLLGSIDSRTIAYCEANNLTLAEPEVSAYRNVE